MAKESRVAEKEAYDFLVQGRYEDAFHAFRVAADIYREEGNHKQSSLCYSSAASCWSLRQGEKVLQNAAKAYEDAASEAAQAGDYEYASLLYRYAAINYEKDMEFLKYSECFYLSKNCQRKHLKYSIFNPHKIHNISTGNEEKWRHAFGQRLYHWLGLEFSFMLWGYGECPIRTFLCGIVIILGSSLLYMLGYLVEAGEVYHPNLLRALYFSTVTYTTVGYGDVTAIGFTKGIAMIEAFSAVFITPIFIVGLSRKYLRV